MGSLYSNSVAKANEFGLIDARGGRSAVGLDLHDAECLVGKRTEATAANLIIPDLRAI